MPAPRKKGRFRGAKNPQLRPQDLRFYLRQLGVKARAFMPLITTSIENMWTMDQFIMELRTSKPFKRMFPGIPDYMAPGEYRAMEREYKQIAQDFGIKLNKKRVGLLFRQEKSPEEVYQLATIFKAVQTTDGIREEFNKLLARRGQKQLDKKGWFRFLGGKADQQIVDIYEAASLRAAGFDIGNRKEARQLAQQIGAPGQGIVDIGKIAAEARALKGVVGPELTREGITDADLILLEGGVDPRGIAPAVERIVASRRALATPSAPARRSAGGQVTLFEGLDEGL